MHPELDWTAIPANLNAPARNFVIAQWACTKCPPLPSKFGPSSSPSLHTFLCSSLSAVPAPHPSSSHWPRIVSDSCKFLPFLFPIQSIENRGFCCLSRRVHPRKPPAGIQKVARPSYVSPIRSRNKAFKFRELSDFLDFFLFFCSVGKENSGAKSSFLGPTNGEEDAARHCRARRRVRGCSRRRRRRRPWVLAGRRHRGAAGGNQPPQQDC